MMLIGIDLAKEPDEIYIARQAVRVMRERREEFNLPWTLACDTTCLRCMPWWWQPFVSATRWPSFDELKWQAYMTSWEKRR